jgi:hypothetical protein
MVYREDARRNPEVLYVFGDNVTRKGMGGQAAQLRYEPNAVGVATKHSPYTYFGEDAADIAAQKRIIDQDMKRLFDHVINGGVVIWPSRGIGTNRADLHNVAPTTARYLEKKLAALIKVGKLHQLGRHDEAEATLLEWD